MEFKPQDIARLVLGYLRDQKCQSAYKEFLTNSSFLKEHVASHQRGKCIITRVNGLSLIDYLTEYTVVYNIVQERLEASEYYEEKGLRTSLVQQLLYLLGRRSGIESRTSTPVENDIIIHSPHLQSSTNTAKSVAQLQNLSEAFNSSCEIIDEISATPVHSLPGNSGTNLSSFNTSKNKSTNTTPKVNKSTDTEEDVDRREKSQEICKEIFTQTFLENTELIEKLADNINKEVSAKSSSSEDRSNFHIGQELDNSAIETIIQRMAKDPIIVNSIEEIIGNGGEEFESGTSPDKNVENEQDKAELNSSEERALLATPKKAQSTHSFSDSIKKRLRSSKKTWPSPVENSPSIEEQNNEAIQSIVAASLSGEKQPQPVEHEPNASANVQTMSVGEIILSESYDNLMHTGTLAGPSIQNQMYVNSVSSGSVLMLQPNVTPTCSSIVPTKNLQVDSVKPYYVIGSQPVINVNIPQTSLKVNNVLTEQDIMSMPTIIVYDNNQQCASTQTVIVPTSVSTSISSTQSHLRTIAPKRPEKVQTLSEYITFYQCSDPSSPIISQPQLESSPSNPRSKLKTGSSTATIVTSRSKKKTDKKPQVLTTQTSKIQTHFETSTTENSNLLDNKLQCIPENPSGESTASRTEVDSAYQRSAVEPKQDSAKNKLVESMPQIVTPKMITQDVKERRSRSTPRNGSHVRQLDFSTPEKWFPLIRQGATSPKTGKVSENKENPVKSPVPGTSKTVRTSLFKSLSLELPSMVTALSDEQNKLNLDTNVATETPEANVAQTLKSVKSCSVNLSWDADLRALAAPTATEENIAKKQKRKRSEESAKEPNNLKKRKENLSKIEDDARKIEVALTGVENQSENMETVVASSSKEEAKKNNKSATGIRRNRITTKKAMSASKIIKNDSEKRASLNVTEVNLSIPESNSAIVEIDSVENTAPGVDNQQKAASEENPPEKQYVVINRDVKSRIRKKCNMENPVKKAPVPEIIVLTNITKIKSCEILDDSKNKLILSPSKLNANKRTLVETENRSPVAETSLIAKTSDNSENQEAAGRKIITPELAKNSSNIPPATAKRNIIPALETPVKFDSIAFPKTPSIFTSPTIDTPFTKAVLDQLSRVDISAIPTPKFPVTPNVPFTPCIGSEQSPFSNRATDYSASSSYYQPSDTEQNKSVEQLLEECRNLETQPLVECSKLQEKTEGDCEGTSASVNKSSQKLQTSESPNRTETNDQSNPSQMSEIISTTVTDKMKAFNHSLIGKKNLHLLKIFSNEVEKNESSSSDDSSTGSCSSSSSDDSESSDSSFSDGLKSAPAKHATPYSLRPRRSATNNCTVDLGANKQPEECQTITPDTDQPLDKNKEKPLTFQDNLLQEMEKKRQRTIARFKDANSTAKTKDNSKQKKQTPKVNERGSKLPQRDKTGKFLKSPVITKCAADKSKTNAKKTLPSKQHNGASASNKGVGKEPNNQTKNPEKLKQSECHSQKEENVVRLKSAYQTSAIKTSLITTKKAKAIVSDDKEIILHLSSDDGSLEPSEMVEAVLLECSPSSTSVAEDNCGLNLDAHPQSTLRENVNTKLVTITEQERQKPLDQEAETMVKLKGLMQMGIHLIPNKSTKKPGMSSEETQQHNVQAAGINDQTTEVRSEEMPHDSGTANLQKEMSQGELEKPGTSKEKSKNLEKASASKGKAGILKTLSTSKEKTEASEKAKAETREKPHVSKGKTESQEKPQISEGKTESREKLQISEGKTEIREKPQISEGKTESREKPQISEGKTESREKPQTSKPKTKTLEKTTLKEESENLEKGGTPKDNSKNKHDDKINSSLEDGELLSDGGSPKKENKFDQHKADKAKRIDSKRTSASRRHSGSIRRHTSQQDRLRDLRELYRYRPNLEGKTKEPLASTSKKSSSSKSSKPSEDKYTSKKTKSVNKVPEKDAETKLKSESVVSSEKQTPAGELDYQVQFDIKTYTEETVTVTHDYSKKANRSLSDYNLDVLTKKISAKVYIAEIDSEVEKFLTFTPFEFLLDIPSRALTSTERRASDSNKSDQSDALQMPSKKKQKPLKILYNQLVQPATEKPRTSVLENLYAPESTSRDYKRSNEGSRVKATEKNRKSEKSEKVDRSKQNTVKEKLSNEETHPKKGSERSSRENAVGNKDNKVEAQESACALSTGDAEYVELNDRENLKKTSDNLTGSHDQDRKHLLPDLEQDLEVVDGIIMLNANSEVEEQEETGMNLESHDELMNYALVGSERIENNEDSFIADNRKRKITERDEEKQHEKKQKTKELLRNIDVDSFLKKLHGET